MSTLKKIAEMANMSISTISRALNDHSSISASTKEKVREIAKLLNYEPNLFAIQLKTKSSKRLGVVVSSLSNFFYQSFISNLEEEARKSGYSLMVLQSSDVPALEANCVKICRQNRVDGLFISLTAETRDFGFLDEFKANNIPVIFFDKTPFYLDSNIVEIPDRLVTNMAVDILIETKKSEILAIFGSEGFSITQKRKSTFIEKMRALSPHTKITFLHAISSEEAQVLSEDFLVTKKTDVAVFCMSDEILSGVMISIQKLKIVYPENVAILAFSDGYLPNLYYPTISYVETSGSKLSSKAFELMIENLEEQVPYQKTHCNFEFHKGGSV
jgi:LacI family transcriptional regulator